jgi:hypothetical protein
MAAQDRDAPRGKAAPQLADHDHLDVAPLGTPAADAVVTPTSDKAPDAAYLSGRVQNEKQCPVGEQASNASYGFATLRAPLEIKSHAPNRTRVGYRLVRLSLNRLDLLRNLPEIAAVRVFAEQVEVTHA